MQRMEGELANTIQTNLPQIAHFQLADNPGRNEPGTGEINYRFLFGFLDAIGYDGWIGCEYKPQGNDGRRAWLARRARRLGRQADNTRRNDSMADIGFIGLGIMGSPMAGQLIKGGHRVHLHSRSGGAAGAHRCRRHRLRDPKDVAQKSDIVITMVPDTPHVEAVLFGDDRRREGFEQRQDRRRHELDLAARDQGIRAGRSPRSVAITSTRRCRAARSAPKPRR